MCVFACTTHNKDFYVSLLKEGEKQTKNKTKQTKKHRKFLSALHVIVSKGMESFNGLIPCVALPEHILILQQYFSTHRVKTKSYCH